MFRSSYHVIRFSRQMKWNFKVSIKVCLNCFQKLFFKHFSGIDDVQPSLAEFMCLEEAIWNRIEAFGTGQSWE